jgi:ABC-2 type transport system ATP-binding protein
MMLKVTRLTKYYGKKIGIEDINFQLEKGIAGFLGENGAGKTTTIKLIMGLLHPGEGTIEIMGKNLWKGDNFHLLKRHIGFLPNEDYLYPRLSGRENLEYVSFLKTNSQESYLKLDKEIDAFGLREALDVPFGGYSTGMKRKLQMLASLIGEPEILIWDEPHNGLDVLSNIKMKALLMEYSRGGRLIFFSSHIIEMVKEICSSVIIIHKGHLAEVVRDIKDKDLTSIYLKATE